MKTISNLLRGKQALTALGIAIVACGQFFIGSAFGSSVAEVVRAQPMPNSAPAGSADVLSDLLTRALADHPAVRSRRSEFLAAQFELDGAKWARFPSFSLQAQLDENQNDRRSARLEQPLWAGGRISSGIDLAQARVLQSESNLKSTQQEILQQTAAVFYDVLRFEARLKAAKENTAEHQRLLELIRRRVQLEVSPDTDRILAESRAQLAKTEEIQILRQLENLRLSLNQLVGSPVGPVFPPPPLKLSPYASDEQALSVALQYSPRRRGVEAQVDAAVAEIGVARARSMPTVVAGYEQVWARSNLANSSDGRGFIGLQYQPGAGLASISASRAAESRRQAALDGILAIERELKTQVQSALSELRNLADQLVPTRSLLRGSEEVVDSYLRQYQIGRKGWLDVLNAQREKTQARIALADVTFGLEQSKLRIMILTGDISAENLSINYD